MLVVFQLAQYCSLRLINNQLETGWWYTYPFFSFPAAVPCWHLVCVHCETSVHLAVQL